MLRFSNPEHSFSKIHGPITVRKRKDRSAAQTAQTRVMQKDKTVYQESQAFDRKTMAQGWLKKRGTELAEPGAIDKANRERVPVKEMIDRYIDEREKIRPLGRCTGPSGGNAYSCGAPRRQYI